MVMGAWEGKARVGKVEGEGRRHTENPKSRDGGKYSLI